jgi:hypothetical protein
VEHAGRRVKKVIGDLRRDQALWTGTSWTTTSKRRWPVRINTNTSFFELPADKAEIQNFGHTGQFLKN